MRLRLILIGVILLLACGALIVMFSHPAGQELLHNPQQFGHDVRQWVIEHPLLSEAALVAIYILLTLLALPVWWVNVLAGYSFGLIGGTVRCVIASGIAAAITSQLWCYLAGDLAHSGKLTRYRIIRVMETYASEHGFKIVVLTRLAHLLPFGLSNYVFGMLEIPWPKVLAGTLLGVIPAVAITVALGAGADWRAHLPFVITIVVLTIGGLAAGSYIYTHHARHAT